MVKKLIITTIAVLVSFSCANLWAQSFPNNHSRILYSWDLFGAATDIGEIYNTQGNFNAGEGWSAYRATGQLKIVLKDYLPSEGTLEVTLRGLSAGSVTDDWIPVSLWSQGRGKFYREDGASYPSKGSFIFIKTDESKVIGNQFNFKFLAKARYSPEKAVFPNPVEAPPIAFSSNEDYTFRIVWIRGATWLQILSRGGVLCTRQLEFKNQEEAFRVIFLGRSNEYRCMPDIQYKNLKIKVPEEQLFFVEVSRSSNAAYDSLFGGQGVAWCDVDNDGLQDIYVTNYDKYNMLFKQNPDHSFAEVAGDWNINPINNSFTSTFADFDDDGRVDLFVANLGAPPILYMNKGNGFQDESGSRGITTEVRESINAIALDINNDGKMDLYVANNGQPHEQYINQGNGYFQRLQMSEGLAGSGTRAVAGDINGDGFMDIYYPRRGSTGVLLINTGGGNFSNQAAQWNININTDPDAPALADLDNDGDLDLLQPVDSFNGDVLSRLLIYRNDGSSFSPSGSIDLDTYGTLVGDVDNDGLVDLYLMVRNKYSSMIYDYGSRIYRNTSVPGMITFEELTGTGAEVIFVDGRGGAMADYNGDGWLDIYGVSKGKYLSWINSNYGRNALLKNETQRYTGSSNNFLQVAILDRNQQNNGIGAKIRIYPAGNLGVNSLLLGHREISSIQGYQSQHSLIEHFGLGVISSVDVRVILPGGRIIDRVGVGANQLLKINPFGAEPKEMQLVKGNNQTGKAGLILTDSVTVRILDVDNIPLSGHSVLFSVKSGGGTLNGPILTTVTASTDQYGLARVAWRLGGQIGVNSQELEVASLKDQTHITNSPLPIRASATPGPASKILKVSGDNQQGFPLETLLNPLFVRVTDDFGNPIGSYNVTFRVKSGNGTLGGQAVNQVNLVTNSSGEAQTTWRLGNTIGTQQVEVFADFNAANPEIFNAVANEPQKQLVYQSGDRQIGTVGANLPQPFVVRLQNFQGLPIMGDKVRFIVVSGGADFSGQDTLEVPTNQQGTASAMATLGTAAGDTIYVFQAQVDGAVGVVTFKASALPGRGVKMMEVSGDDQAGKAGRTLQNPLIVKVTDAYNNPVPGYSVDFTVTSGNGTIDGQTTSRIVTNPNGLAIAYLKLGTTIGVNTVNAIAQDLDGSPITFSTEVRAGDPTRIFKVSGDGQRGTFGQPLSQPFVAAVTDSFSNPVVNHPVHFQVTKGGGKIDGLTIKTLYTDQVGRASAILTLGTQSYFNEVTVTSQYNGVDIGQPLVFTATTGAGDPDSLAYVSGNYQVGGIDAALPKPFVVKVTDINAIPIIDHDVTFWAISSGTHFAGSQTITVKTDQNGEARAIGTIGSNFGNNNNVFQAIAKYNDIPLRNSPIEFFASGRRSSAAKIKYESGNGLIGTVGEFLTDSLKVKIVDSDEVPVFGQPVNFEIIQGSGTLPGIRTSVSVDSDSNGIAAVTVRLGSKPGSTRIRAFADDGMNDLAGSPILFDVTAVIGPPDPKRSTLSATSNVIADGNETSKVIVTLRDAQDNPVPDKVVNIFTEGLDVHVNQPPLPTDVNGMAQGSISSLSADSVFVRTRVDGQDMPDTVVTVLFKPGPPRNAIPFGNNQVALRATELPQPIGIHLMDENNNSIEGVLVSFRVTSGGGYIPQPQPVSTDSDGKAQVNWVLGSKIGGQNAEAIISGMILDPVQFLAVATPPRPGSMEIVSGNRQIGLVHTALNDSFVVAVKDSAGEPAEGLLVFFSLIKGQGQFFGNPDTTDGRGYASVLFKPGSTTGEHTIHATVAGLGTFNEFFCIVQSVLTIFLDKIPIASTARPQEIFELRVTARDAWGRTLANQPLKFEIAEGNGSLQETMPVSTDSSGSATVLWTVGMSGKQTVNVMPVNIGGSPVVFTTQVINAGPELTVPEPSEFTILAENTIQFGISAYDADGDKVYYGARHLPAGASFDSTNTLIFNWTPVKLQADSTYGIKFLAWDTFGATDTASVKITVESKNLPPVILSIAPRDTNIQRIYEEMIHLRVDASDPDPGDSLTYFWQIRIDNVDFFYGDKPDLIFPAARSYSDYIMVWVKVSDGKAEKVVRWHISLIEPNSVELSSFEATADRKAIRLTWHTASESDNLGFNVMRGPRESGPYQKINGSLIPPAADGIYTFMDTHVEAGARYFYKIQDVDRNGRLTEHGPVDAQLALPTTVMLAQNHPNPFNPKTTIQFELPEPQHVELRIYNIAGQLVRVLASGTFSAGSHDIVWDARDESGQTVPTGIYFYSLQTRENVVTKKLLLTK